MNKKEDSVAKILRAYYGYVDKDCARDLEKLLKPKKPKSTPTTVRKEPLSLTGTETNAVIALIRATLDNETDETEYGWLGTFHVGRAVLADTLKKIAPNQLKEKDKS